MGDLSLSHFASLCFFSDISTGDGISGKILVLRGVLRASSLPLSKSFSTKPSPPTTALHCVSEPKPQPRRKYHFAFFLLLSGKEAEAGLTCQLVLSGHYFCCCWC